MPGLLLRREDPGANLPPEGVHKAVFCGAEDMGEHTAHYPEGLKTYERVRVVFQLDALNALGRRYRATQVFPKSTSNKSRLYGFLRSLLGGELDAMLSRGLNLESLIGRNARIRIAHVQKDGRTYANIESVMPLGTDEELLDLEDPDPILDA